LITCPAVVTRNGLAVVVESGGFRGGCRPLLEAFEEAVEKLPSVTSVFTIAGSAAEVAEQLVTGQLDLGLIHLPPTDARIDYRVVARYQSGIAVRSDDPLAERETIHIEDLRDREVVIDFARPNPALLADVTRRLRERGVTRIVHATATTRGSEIEMAAQARNRRLVVMLAYAPGSTLARVFSPPHFTLVPIDQTTWSAPELAVAWLRERGSQCPEHDRVVDQLALALSET
jgi:hypothetical protein